MCFWHPGRILVGPDSEFPKVSRRERKAVKRAKKAEKIELRAREKAEKAERQYAKRYAHGQKIETGLVSSIPVEYGQVE